MVLTMFFLAALYLFFLVVLSEYGGIGTYVFMKQYQGSAVITGQPKHLASALMTISGVMEF
ncbi:MAG: hypothetical protein OIN86_17400 [Candidatus Methanoperedens sp.]|nr:hypothetical protein [Candidatus Methanoperedens sp.]